ncbi:MAG: MotA/TolQ/ExbB proton channel family protein [candidate division NC10 bacterium]|nr:MotA/TolQ/ExbB proton channel family protein [candidate division NC10 bacterium]MDE2322737.1 MotA/TolQ/ExbB proton channel family protein [candidate division NC10 bacterium]
MMGQGFLQVIANGGITMVVLGIFSIFSLAVIGERFYTYYKAQQATGQVAEKGLQYVADGKMAEALRLCERNSGSPVARVLEAGLLAIIDREHPVLSDKQFSRRLESCKGAMQRATSTEISRLERYLGSLATLGNVSPFVGLFGTVLGIIRAFEAIAKTGSGGIGTVSAGIAEALVATAAGLFVAIPAVIAYNYFVGRVKLFTAAMDNAASAMVDSLLDQAAHHED